MKKITLTFIFALLATLIFSASPVAAQTPSNLDIRTVVNAGYVMQDYTQPEGEVKTDFHPVVLTGMEFRWKNHIWCFSGGIAGLPDEGETTPRVAPYLAVHIGSADNQFFIGGVYDVQNGGDNNLSAVFGYSKAFDIP
jgi:hypothetical protein